MPKKTKSKHSLQMLVHHRIKLAVVPHKKNNYRPHLIRWRGLAIFATVALLAQCSFNLVQTGSVLGRATTISSNQLLDDTNAARHQHGLASLKENAKLDHAARLKAEDMFHQQYWAHTAPNGTQPWSWFDQAGYTYVSAGENLAKGFHTSAGTVTGWMNSQEHRENILKPAYKDVGFATVQGMLNGEQTTLVVALYGNPVGANAVVAPTERPAVLSATDKRLSIIARIGVGLSSMTPVLLGTFVLACVVIVSALLAHAYRNKLPKALRLSWYRHHGLYKAVGMSAAVLVVIILYGGGQV